MPDRSPNVFVLTVDSLRADAYEAWMDKLAATIQGVEFRNAFATASNTGSSMPALAAGVYCDRVANATPNLKLGESRDDDGLTTLAEALSDAGYECSLWSDNVIFGAERNYDRGFGGGRTGTPNWKNRAQTLVQRTGSDRLFDACRWAYFNVLGRIESAVASDANYYVSAETHHRSVLDALEDTSGGQMHWIHYMDVHHPFEPPAEYLADRPLHADRRPEELADLSSAAIVRNRGAGTSDEDVEDVEQAYLAACEYLRDRIASFVETLIERDHYVPGHDVLVFTADHGEGFDRELHGMLGHTPTPAFWDDLVRVPLIVGHPAWDAAAVEYQVSQIDLIPTVLRALDVPVPDSAEGTAAERPSDLRRERIFFTATGPYRTYHGVRSRSGRKLFADRISDSDSVELTGDDGDELDRERVLLTRVEDGEETIEFERDLDARTKPSNAADRKHWRELHRRLCDARGEVATRRFDAMLTDETVAQLEQLGYVDNIR
ncbi:sulfatase-like hydrolase/transferase [Halosolutus gelatinilyticus]|uniref:sulfatase-like hydrolase/transferase n=1 Tax=Halosolutus gelatinilyticus TaxID=2931975 RepID=UPI001FF3AFC0|nr:sulfatase-like hydrolase/transferase [Halosolutus gelatinilyticus]